MDEITFVSYARTDGEFALKLANDLRAANVKVWVDQLDIKAGETWDRAVEDALEKCTGLLIILSPGAISSRAVLDEVSFALEEKKKVVPVLYQTCEIPFRLRRIQRIDCTFNYSAGLSKLVDALSGMPLSSVGNGAAENNATSSVELSADTGNSGERVPRESRSSSRRPRLITALWTGLAGAILGGAAEAMIYANDKRLGVHAPTLLFTIVGGGLIAGTLWFFAGAIAGLRRFPLVSAVGTSLVFLVSWIGVFGTYADTMGAAVICGWPVGGIIGATVGHILRTRGESSRRDY
jgi:TIR domain